MRRRQIFALRNKQSSGSLPGQDVTGPAAANEDRSPQPQVSEPLVSVGPLMPFEIGVTKIEFQDTPVAPVKRKRGRPPKNRPAYG